MLKYPGGFLLCSIFIGGIGALLTAQAAAAESAVSIDKTQIRAVIEDTTTTITLPVQYHAPAAATRTLNNKHVVLVQVRTHAATRNGEGDHQIVHPPVGQGAERAH